MSLSDCPECWMAICDCGYQYKGWSIKDLQALVDVLNKVIEEKKQENKS